MTWRHEQTDKISRILWNRFHNIPTLASILSILIQPHPQAIFLHTLILPRYIPCCIFLSYFPTKLLYSFHISPCVLHLRSIHLYFNSLMFGEERKLLSTILCYFLHFPVTYSILGYNIFFQILCLSYVRTDDSLEWTKPASTLVATSEASATLAALAVMHTILRFHVTSNFIPGIGSSKNIILNPKSISLAIFVSFKIWLAICVHHFQNVVFNFITGLFHMQTFILSFVKRAGN
jgi:hypothetical protein